MPDRRDLPRAWSSDRDVVLEPRTDDSTLPRLSLITSRVKLRAIENRFSLKNIQGAFGSLLIGLLKLYSALTYPFTVILCVPCCGS